jgi:hypothetical protein
VRAVVVAPGFVDVVIVRGLEVVVFGYEEVLGEEWEVDVGWEEAFPCWMAEWARKAARKLERKGRFVGISFSFSFLFSLFMCNGICVVK